MTVPRSRPIQAAGAVVFDAAGKVLLVHRPTYDDWSLPKGKREANEYRPTTAVREVAEETATEIRLGAPIQTIGYATDKGNKVVHFWRATVQSAGRFKPNGEVDKISWLSPAKALRRLSYADERQVLEYGLTIPDTVPIAIVRHGKAMLRKNWTGKDYLRPLDTRGRKQSRDLIAPLSAFGIVHLASSTSTRCVQTLQPYAKQLREDIRTWSTLAEEHGIDNPKDVESLMRRLIRDAISSNEPIVISGHRPVLPTMLDVTGVEPRPMPPGMLMVAHLDADRRTIAAEWHRPQR